MPRRTRRVPGNGADRQSSDEPIRAAARASLRRRARHSPTTSSPASPAPCEHLRSRSISRTRDNTTLGIDVVSRCGSASAARATEQVAILKETSSDTQKQRHTGRGALTAWSDAQARRGRQSPHVLGPRRAPNRVLVDIHVQGRIFALASAVVNFLLAAPTATPLL